MAQRLSEFAKATGTLTQQQFEATYRAPFLLVYEPQKEEEEGVKSFQTLMMPAMGMGAGTRDPMVHALEKVTRPHAMATVGRTPNHDVVLSHGSISKFHAFFKFDPKLEAVTITDAGSTNGTTVNSKPLEKNVPVPLKGGETIKFGGVYRATFHTPQTLFRYLAIVRQ